MVKRIISCCFVSVLLMSAPLTYSISAETIVPAVSQSNQATDIGHYIQNGTFRKAIDNGVNDSINYCKGVLISDEKIGTTYNAIDGTALGSPLQNMIYYLVYDIGEDDKVYITDVEYPISYNGIYYINYIQNGGVYQDLPFGAYFSDNDIRKYFDEDVGSFYYVHIPDEVDGLPVAGISPKVNLELNAVKDIRYTSGKNVDVTSMPEFGDVDGDGYVTSSDALSVLRFTVGADVNLIETNADLDQDGDITSADALAILRKTTEM